MDLLYALLCIWHSSSLQLVFDFILPAVSAHGSEFVQQLPLLRSGHDHNGDIANLLVADVATNDFLSLLRSSHRLSPCRR